MKAAFEDMKKAGIYANKPKKLVTDILTWYKAKSYDSLKTTKDSQVNKEVHKRTIENLKAKGNKYKNNYNSNHRQKIEKSTTVSRILKNIDERTAAKDSR